MVTNNMPTEGKITLLNNLNYYAYYQNGYNFFRKMFLSKRCNDYSLNCSLKLKTHIYHECLVLS